MSEENVVNFSTQLDALSDDDLWHIAGQIEAMSGGSLFHMSQHECVTALRASFMDPDTARQYMQINAK
jgi:hypothetical protein